MTSGDGHGAHQSARWKIRRASSGRATSIVSVAPGKAPELICRLPRRKWDEGRIREHEALARVLVSALDIREAAKRVVESTLALEAAIDRSEGRKG